MQYRMELSVLVKHLALVFWTTCLLACSNALATEDRLNDWECGHCQRLVQTEIGRDAFEARLAELVAQHSESKRRWTQIQTAVSVHFSTAERRLKNIGQSTLSAWTNLNAKSAKSESPIASVPIIFPHSAAIQTLNNLRPTQWLSLTDELTQRVFQLQVSARMEQASFLLQSIEAGKNVFAAACNLSSRWALELHSAPQPSAVLAASKTGSKANAADEYWTYYADCDHWQVTFDIR